MKISHALLGFLAAFPPFAAAAENEFVIPPGLLPQDCIFSASFQQKQTMVGLPKPLESAGKIFFHCETGLIWQQQSPLAETRVYTRENKVFHIGEEGKPQQAKGKLEENLAKLLTGLMGGDTRYLNRYFKAVSASDTQLELLPKGRRVAKFIGRMSIHSKAEAKEIRWENNIGNETLLTVFAEQSYPRFSMEGCNKSINNIGNICQLLVDASPTAP